MPTPFPNLAPAERGTVHLLRHQSRALAGNPWNDPLERDLHVYTPPGHTGAGLPMLLFLPGYSGTGEKFLARGMSEMSLASRIDRLMVGQCPPFVGILPDGMTTLGGSQYVDSPGIGNYATWLAREIVPWLAERFSTRGRLGVIGKSSGGFGALHLALTFPDVVQAVACHSGDLGFDLCYLGDIVPAVRGVQAAGGLERFVSAFWEKEAPTSNDFAALNLLCMACAYSPDLNVYPLPARLPVDFITGAVDFSVFEAWKAWDPLVRDLSALGELKDLFIDCGSSDEHLLHLGARRLHQRLEHLGIAHTYDEFPGGHRGTSFRYDVSIRRLAVALSK